MKQAPFSLCLVSAIIFAVPVFAQTSGTGMLNGSVVDASGAAVRSATLTLENETTKQQQTISSNGLGLFAAPLLPPGTYTLIARSNGFAEVAYVHISVGVDATTTFHVRLLAGVRENIDVHTDAASEDAAPNMDSVADGELIANLPLSTRNYTQILGLNSGIASEVSDAGTVGRGATSYAAGTGGFSSDGAGTNDNNFQMDGVDVNDIQGSGLLSRGIPVPNPDAIEEFRVVTQPYDASQGRNSGAAINVVTHSGTGMLHGTLFEYLRNDAFNANTFFRKATGQPRPALKQNQFGGTLSGPLGVKGLDGFGTYQDTRQSNGLDPTCSSSVGLPPLTNDRSAAGIGAVFQGQRGYFQNAFGGVGPPIAANGSNIHPVALTVLQLKNPDGSYFIPTPQRIVSTTGSFDSRGLSTFSIACPYREHQGMANLDWQINEHHRIAVRSFAGNSNTQSTLPTPLLGGAEVPGSPYHLGDHFRTISLAHTWIVRPNLVNEARFGFNRMSTRYTQQYPFSYSGIGATVPAYDNAAPVMKISGASFGSSVNQFAGAINTFVAQDAVAYSWGRHFLHAGGGMERVQDNQPLLNFYGAQLFLSFADFLLGQNAAQNGTAAICAFTGCGAGYSDVAYSQDTPGTIVRAYRVSSGNLYVQDDIHLTPQLTLNLGLRFERLGDFADKLGHNTSFYPSLANTSPPSSGTLQGYVVPANYAGTVPAGVTRLANNYGVDGDGQETWQPRVGAAWQLPGGDRMTLHAGYGLFRSRITADLYNQSINTPPFARLRQYQGTDAVSASLTLAQPLPSFTATLPSFAPYCPPNSTACAESPVFTGLAPNVVPPMFQRYSLDLETRLTRSLTFDLGYSGSKAQHLLTEVLINQAAFASPSTPVNGQTTTTLANLPYRVPLPGFAVKNLAQYQTSGSSFYNALQASLHQRTSSFGELLVAYTWARDLTDVYDGLPSTRGGTILGDQTHPENDYGPDLFLRKQRLVVTYFVKLPSPKERWAAPLLRHWVVTGVGVAQTGHALTITDQNQFSAYGIATDRAQLVSGCNPVLPGSAEMRLTAFFKTACFTTPPVIGNDHVATGFGDSPIGLIQGPRQTNLDAAITRTFPMSKWREGTAIVFRGEAFNVFNHTQFQDPDTELTSATFGRIRSTAVNARVVQLAVRVLF
jgi:hypothetical protein